MCSKEKYYKSVEKLKVGDTVYYLGSDDLLIDEIKSIRITENDNKIKRCYLTLKEFSEIDDREQQVGLYGSSFEMNICFIPCSPIQIYTTIEELKEDLETDLTRITQGLKTINKLKRIK